MPLGLGRPYWVDDPHFDIEFHLRELALPAPGTREQLGEQVARIHARQLDRSRPLWEAYVITGLEDGRAAFYSKIHHAAIDGVSGAEILETIMDVTVEPRDGRAGGGTDFVPRPMPSTVDLVRRGLRQMVVNPVELLQHRPPVPAVRRPAARRGELPRHPPGQRGRRARRSAARRGGPTGADTRELKAPRTPLNGSITAHRRFAFGSIPLDDVKTVKNHFGMTVNDVVMALTAAALRRWLLDHDALPDTPLVAAVPVSIRTEDQAGSLGNQVSVMLAELPTHLGDAGERLAFMRRVDGRREAGLRRRARLAAAGPLGARARPRCPGLPPGRCSSWPPCPGVIFNLFVSNVPGPQLPLYIAGARVEGIYPVSAVTDMTGGLNITLFSYDGSLDFGLIACREMVPDVWHLIGYLEDAMAEMVALVDAD